MKMKDLTKKGKKACLGIFPLHHFHKLVDLQLEWLNLFQMPGVSCHVML